MSDDPRCCGTGTCLINAEGICWCGQRWDGDKMSFPDKTAPDRNTDPVPTPADPPPRLNPSSS